MNENIDELFKRHYRPLCLYALHYVHDVDVAEDIVQDCFSEWWEKTFIKGENVDNVRAYLYVSVKNRSLNCLKKEAGWRGCLLLSDLEDTLTDEEVEERSEEEARMWTVIGALPARCREIFLLNKRDGLKYKEIAERLNLSVHTVDNQVNKALKRIRAGVKRVYCFFFN